MTEEKRLFPSLGSLTAAVILMIITVLFMLAGVVPVPGGHQEIVYQTPVFIAVLALLLLSTLRCVFKRRISVRNAGFHLVHLGFVLLLIGAFVGYLKEQKANFHISAISQHDTTQIRLPNGETADLGFSVSLNDFRVEHYNPDLVFYVSGQLESKHRISEGAVLDLGKAGEVKIDKIIPDAYVNSCELDGEAELLIFDKDGKSESLVVNDELKNVKLANGDLMMISRVYNNLPRMQQGMSFEETDYPVHPGVILRIMSKEKLAIISLGAGQEPEMLSPDDKAHAPEIPDMRYRFPSIKKIDIEGDSGTGIAAVVLTTSNATHTLIQDGGMLSSALLNQNCALKIQPPVDKRYIATLEIEDEDGNRRTETLETNKPVDQNGWRLYLDSYEMGYHGARVTVTARRDPGNNIAVAGILFIMIGMPILLHYRKRKES